MDNSVKYLPNGKFKRKETGELKRKKIKKSAITINVLNSGLIGLVYEQLIFDNVGIGIFGFSAAILIHNSPTTNSSGTSFFL